MKRRRFFGVCGGGQLWRRGAAKWRGAAYDGDGIHGLWNNNGVSNAALVTPSNDRLKH